MKVNNNITPICAYILGDLWKDDVVNDSKYLELYMIPRNKLNNKYINNKMMSHKELKDDFVYFSLGQEYELYVARGLPLMLGSFEDIKYSIHQHFIKDCYKSIDIPCLDYIFIHGTQKARAHGIKREFVKNAVSTGILLEDYKKNRIKSYKYNINNFLIDCIFNFDSINNDNKKLNLPIEEDDDDNDDNYVPGIYADKIEGFRDAGLYLHGDHNPLFNSDAVIGEHIQYLRNWKQMFTKYKIASDSELEKHFIWCNKRITKLIEIINETKDNYLAFVYNTLKQKNVVSDIATQAFDDRWQINSMIIDLSNILIKRCKFYIKCTASTAGIQHFTKIIRIILGEPHINTYNSKLYNNPILEDLILYEDKSGSSSLSGGILSIKQINKQGTRLIQETTKKTNVIDHNKIYESFKNVPISQSKDIRKFKDMPKSFQEYYKNKGGSNSKYINISNYCNFRLVNKTDN